MNITTQTLVTVIHHRRFRSVTSRGQVPVASCAHGLDPTTRWHMGYNARELVIDEFFRLWAAHGAAGLIVFASDQVVPDLLREQAAVFPGLLVRDVVSGGKLTETWNACRDAFKGELMGRLLRCPGLNPWTTGQRHSAPRNHCDITAESRHNGNHAPAYRHDDPRRVLLGCVDLPACACGGRRAGQHR
ncbi:MAG: hypothetical protein Q4G50_09570 [Corynebacterium sp.]|uniref:hypothetical protein n=1 Tax=Corynebacterium sp. TaxID=1720 RepID=UPI0026DF177D|nr:hypothetical protein [Corynebacterium sp.]MDO5670240.1 hypothetical protein [Corynebacterium sp.]